MTVFPCRPRVGEGRQLGGQLRCLGRADPLEDLQRLPQQGLALYGVAADQGTAAQAGQCVRLVPGACGIAGGVQGVGLAERVAQLALDTQRLLLGAHRRWVVSRQQPDLPKRAQDVGQTQPVTELAVQAK
jgi:hypothetical protein